MSKQIAQVILLMLVIGGAYMLGRSHKEIQIIEKIVYKEKEDAKKVEDIHKEVITMPDVDKRNWLFKYYLIAE